MLPPTSAATTTGLSTPSLRPSPAELQEERLRGAAERLEASFLKEMLTAAGLGRPSALGDGGFGGGAGETQFASYLVEAQAAEMARAGGIGLAESLFESLKARDAS